MTQRPAFLIVMVLACAVATFFCGVAALHSIANADAVAASLRSVVTLFLAFCSYVWVKRLQNPMTVATFTLVGVTNERGETFEWSQIQRIWKFTGVLFLRDSSNRPWVVRLDPAEVNELAEAVAFIKQYAPSHLSERL